MTPRIKPGQAHGSRQGLSALPALLALLLPTTPLLATLAKASPQPLRFVVITKVVHPWYEVVRGGAEDAAAMIQRQSGAATTIDYQAPAQAEVTALAELLAAAIRSRPTGISIDLLDARRLQPLLEQARRRTMQSGYVATGRCSQITPAFGSWRHRSTTTTSPSPSSRP